MTQGTRRRTLRIAPKPLEVSDVPQSCVVFTPRPLADAMVQALGDLPRASWLEPCVGAGVFLEALSAAQVPPNRIMGLDVDPSARAEDRLARTLRNREFLQWSLTTSDRFSRIVANPPYIALNRMPRAVQDAALKVVVPGTKHRIGLGANSWFAFLCAGISLLRRRGSLAFLLPAACEYANYAAPLRASIGHLFETIEIYRCRRPLFEAVLEGSVVLVARRYRGSSRHNAGHVRRTTYRTPEALIRALAASGPAIESDGKGQVIEFSSPHEEVAATKPKRTLQARGQVLGDVIQLRLGGVTGDADYFLLSDERRRDLKLPARSCRPVISRARHLSAGMITVEDWRQLRDDGERVWLFDPAPSQVRLRPVKEYFDLDPAKGGCDRTALKVRSREPWFRTPIQRHIDGFMSGMSGWGPWVVFRETPRLAATNTLYIVHFRGGETVDAKAAWAMWLLTTDAARHLRRIGRRYADGLVKFEPGDIAELPIATPAETHGAFEAYLRAVRLLLRGKKAASRHEADKWF